MLRLSAGKICYKRKFRLRSKGFLFIFRRLLHVTGIIYIKKDERKGSQRLEFTRVVPNLVISGLTGHVRYNTVDLQAPTGTRRAYRVLRPYITRTFGRDLRT
jgi:hypothetical protein